LPEVPYRITVTLVGSSFKLVFDKNTALNYEEPEMRWTMRRKGAIGISVPPGSEIRITRMRIKILR
jgi:hypothetical protein